MNNRVPITAVELFAGAGLMSEGFRRHGFKTIFAAEMDPRAVRSFNRNLEPVAQVWDATQVRSDLRSQVILAGPPCQGFSSLGKRQPHDERNRLSLTVVDWAIANETNVVVVENVPQFLSSEYWGEVKSKMEAHGYESVEWVLDAADFGAPQHRVRAFAILSRIGLPKRPHVVTERYRTVKEAFSGLNKRKRDPMHIAPEPSTLAYARFKLIPLNGDKRDLIRDALHLCPPSWKKMGAQAVDVWGRMNLNKPANTLRCSFQNASKGRYIHPIENRVITLREGARLQGIPDTWVFEGDRSSIARQIGNGVPIPLAEAVAQAVSDLFA
jgi:DNA (cytosine-5)-methyltransferase 1